MADQAIRVVRDWKAATRKSFIIADGITVYEGMLCGVEGGYLNHWADGASDVFAGLLLNGESRADTGVLIGETSDSIPPRAWVNMEPIILTGLSSVGNTPTQAKVGDYVYCGTSNPDDMTLESSGRNHPIGWLCDFRSATDVDVCIFGINLHLVQAIA